MALVVTFLNTSAGRGPQVGWGRPWEPLSSVSLPLMMGLSWRGEEEPMMQREEEEEDIEHGSVWCWCRRLAEEERRGF